MRQRHIADVERPEAERPIVLDNAQLDLFFDPRFDQLFMHQPRSEGRGIQRHAKVLREIGDCPDMIFVRMRQHDAEQVFRPFLDEIEISEHQIDTGIPRV